MNMKNDVGDVMLEKLGTMHKVRVVTIVVRMKTIRQSVAIMIKE